MHNDEWFDKLKQNIEDFEANPNSNQPVWNKAAVWGKIEARQTKKRRILPIWWLSAASVLVIIGTVWWQRLTQNKIEISTKTEKFNEVVGEDTDNGGSKNSLSILGKGRTAVQRGIGVVNKAKNPKKERFHEVVSDDNGRGANKDAIDLKLLTSEMLDIYRDSLGCSKASEKPNIHAMFGFSEALKLSDYQATKVLLLRSDYDEDTDNNKEIKTAVQSGTGATTAQQNPKERVLVVDLNWQEPTDDTMLAEGIKTTFWERITKQVSLFKTERKFHLKALDQRPGFGFWSFVENSFAETSTVKQPKP